MKCTSVEKFLPLYVADDLAGARRRRHNTVAAHLAVCGSCARKAAEYQASREMFRAVLVPPDFDEEFYAGIRNNVLARIRSDRTPAAPRGFLRLPAARLAYAASLGCLILAAALALDSYMRRTPTNDAQRQTIAAAAPEQTATPAALKTPPPVQTKSRAAQASQPSEEPARSNANGLHFRVAVSPRVNATNDTPMHARRKRLAPSTAAPEREVKTETAGTNVASNAGGMMSAQSEISSAAQPDISRIEIQTSDPNIRIIWLAPQTEESKPPLP
ncbi:MAG TPA: zf-HC2 domain-containing protein [Pyrinomonadaceae bacterium]|nr:zf-HC2 domain-containing protein [Pyrinomonadaceae bacterium]